MIDVSVSNKTPELFQMLEAAVSRSIRVSGGHPYATANPLSSRYGESIQIIKQNSLESRAGAKTGFAATAGIEDPQRSIALHEILPALDEMLTRKIAAI